MAKYTKADYTEVAPFVQSIGDFSAAAIESKLAAIPELPEPVEVADPAKADIVNLFNTVYTDYVSVTKAVEANGGILKLAKAHNMTASQCKTCLKEFEAMLALYKTSEDES